MAVLIPLMRLRLPVHLPEARMRYPGNERPNPDCAVEKVVNAEVEAALRDAEALLIARLGMVSLAELACNFDTICPAAQDARVSCEGRVRPD